jgi:hypothetical protein
MIDSTTAARNFVAVLSVIIDHQDRLSRETYGEFGHRLLATSADVEYVGEGDGVAYELTEDALDEGELPIWSS